jgi:hypothetical protein
LRSVSDGDQQYADGRQRQPRPVQPPDPLAEQHPRQQYGHSRIEVGPGRCARFPGGLPHRYANEGTNRALMAMIVVIPPAPA